VVPWPARPLPGSATINQAISSYTQIEGPLYATAINPELMRFERCSGAILVGVLPSPRGGEIDKPNTAYAPAGIDPESWFFHYRKQNNGPPTAQTESILRFVVYRHQVASERFPSARPNLVQITPLIDRVTHYPDPTTGTTLIDDPFLLFKSYENTGAPDFFVPFQGIFSRNPNTFSVSTATASASINPYLQLPDEYDNRQLFDPKTMWVRDTMPVTKGANYQYLVVHFTERGEIARVIPTNIISH
jgi:hypothetical protein